MKKISKIVFLIIIIILLNGLFCNKSIAMSDLIKDKIDFKTVEDDGEPEEYNVLIDGTKLIQTVKLPDITMTFEKVLYGHDDLMDIKLLTSNKQEEGDTGADGEDSGNEAEGDTGADEESSENEAQENEKTFSVNIKNLTQSVFKGSFHISAAAMLLLLLYIALIVANSTLKTGENDLEEKGEKRKRRLLRKTVLKNLKDKLFIQEWIIGVITLGALPFLINFAIYLSDYIMYSSPISVQSEETADEGDIIVYVKGGFFPTSQDGISGNMSNNTTFSNYMFIGDSRIVGMTDALNAEQLADTIIYDNSNSHHMYTRQFGTDIFIGCSGRGYNWFVNYAISEAEKRFSEIPSTTGLNVIIWLGTNDPYQEVEDSYANTINQLATKWGRMGITVTYANVGPGRPDYNFGLINFPRFNHNLKQKLSPKVRYMDDYTFIKQLNEIEKIYVWVDVVHYTHEVSIRVYNFFKGVESSDLITTGSGINMGKGIRDFYFTTNIEGLVSLLSFYQGLDTFALLASWAILICKFTLLIVFLLRVYVLGIIIAISPILVVISTYKKINQQNIFLKKWVTVFLYLVFLRPVLYVIYYAFVKIRPVDANAEPIVLIILSITLTLVCISTVVKAFNSMFKRVSKKRR